MWRAYTREKPARQGLALIIVVVSSAAVAAFAGSVMNQKATPLLTGDDQAPGAWPISFKLPPDFEATTAIRASQLDTGLVSMNRRAIFRNKTDARRRIGIGHRKGSESNEVMDAVMAVAERAASDPAETIEPVYIPAIDPEWRFLKKTRADSVTYVASLTLPDRTVVRLAYVTPSAGSKDQRYVAAICNSVTLKEGFTDPEDSD